MIKFLIVAMGAGLGGGLRYWISSESFKYFPVYFPFGTLIVNLIGSAILGVLIFGFDEKELVSSYVKLFIGVGFCGGLTTFSTFSLETFNLLRDSQYLFAGLNIGLNLILTLVGIYLGYLLTR